MRGREVQDQSAGIGDSRLHAFWVLGNFEHYAKDNEQLLKAVKQGHHMITFAFQKVNKEDFCGARMDFRIFSTLLMGV